MRSREIRAALDGRRAVPVPEFLFTSILGRLGFSWLPPGALSHIKYPQVVDSSAFQEATGFTHAFDETQAMESFRLDIPD